MTDIPISLATEDELSEAVLSQLLEKSGRYLIGASYRGGGFGYLKRTIAGWNRAAIGTPLVVLTDLDSAECPPRLIAEWLPVPKHHNLLFRVAVREVESWLLADRIQLADFLHVRPNLLPLEPDSLPDPKASLIAVARQSRLRLLREAIVPKPGSTAKIGPDYNGQLGRFVRQRWDIEEARANSISLQRAWNRIVSFEPQWPQ